MNRLTKKISSRSLDIEANENSTRAKSHSSEAIETWRLKMRLLVLKLEIYLSINSHTDTYNC